jgi:chaperonin GroES
MAIQPLADRILIEPLEAEVKTAGGIFIPDNAKEKPQKGKIVAMGPGKKTEKGDLIAPEVSIGDIVLYGKYAGTEVTYSDKTYLMVKENDILAKI